jgi:hypothetical protein
MPQPYKNTFTLGTGHWEFLIVAESPMNSSKEALGPFFERFYILGGPRGTQQEKTSKLRPSEDRKSAY